MTRIIVIGGSAGSFKVVSRILSALPEGFKVPIVICMHRLKNLRSGFATTLSLNSRLRINEAFDKENLLNNSVYIAPSNYHLMVDHNRQFVLSVETPVNHSRPSIDILMDSVAEVYRENTLGILLSGANSDGAKGMKKIHENGGITVVQDPLSCDIRTMPESCLNLFNPTKVLNIESIINFMLDFEKLE